MYQIILDTKTKKTLFCCMYFQGLDKYEKIK